MASHGPPTVSYTRCPGCQRGMIPPIFFCQAGHSVCGACTERLRPSICPLCQHPMTQMRNRPLEIFINRATVQCPHRAAGCPQSPMFVTVAEHAQVCNFRPAECPLAARLGNCSWTGAHVHIMDHMKEKHPSMFTEGLSAEIEMEGLTMRECDCRVHVAVHQWLVFIVTFKLDSIQRMAYWNIQYMGPQRNAHNFNYTIQVTSKRDPHRKVMFTERCSSDSTKNEDIFHQCLCAVLPLNYLETFSANNTVSYRFFISKNNPIYRRKRKYAEAASDRFLGDSGAGPSNDQAQDLSVASRSTDMTS